jgi:hypothetical protein
MKKTGCHRGFMRKENRRESDRYLDLNARFEDKPVLNVKIGWNLSTV